ncbi:MAG: hypothetical protein C0392_13315 [Syntrophus sp. (in: bacteria)]|nr:hypothetical protein [Syntrophus sp. (in: bacteria)]
MKNLHLSKKYVLNIIHALAAIGVIIFYAVCGDSCSYLKGELFGLDLKYIGILLMGVIICLTFLKKEGLLLMLLSVSMGVEVFLVAYQVRNGVYCPFCFSFGVMLTLLFLLNLDLRRKLVIALFIALGFISFLIFFKGSVVPTYSITHESSTPVTLSEQEKA